MDKISYSIEKSQDSVKYYKKIEGSGLEYEEVFVSLFDDRLNQNDIDIFKKMGQGSGINV